MSPEIVDEKNSYGKNKCHLETEMVFKEIYLDI